MVNEIGLLKVYFKLFFSKWYVLVSAALGILGFFLYFITPSQTTIIIIVITISFVGIISSGYLVYRDLFKIIPDEFSLAYLPPKIGNPEIAVYQIGGNEYEYGFSNLYDNQLIQADENKTVLPHMAGHFKFTIRNIGYVKAEILSINGNVSLFDFTNNPLGILIMHALGPDLEPVQYPITLEHEEETSIILYASIRPNSKYTDAEIAVKIRELLSSKKIETLFVKIVIADTNGKTTTFNKDFSFSTEMLFNLYINHWRTLNKKDLLKLAGVK